jgi:hypothetical protein
LRLVWNAWPSSRIEATRLVVPFGVMCTPLQPIQPLLPLRHGRQDLGLPVLLPAQPLPPELPPDQPPELTPRAFPHQRSRRVRPLSSPVRPLQPLGALLPSRRPRLPARVSLRGRHLRDRRGFGRAAQRSDAALVFDARDRPRGPCQLRHQRPGSCYCLCSTCGLNGERTSICLNFGFQFVLRIVQP